MTNNTLSFIGENDSRIEQLYASGFDAEDYDMIISNLPNSIIKNVTEVHKGELYIILQNHCSHLVVQLIGSPEDYSIGKSLLTQMNK